MDIYILAYIDIFTLAYADITILIKYICIITAPIVPAACLRVYAFDALTTRLRVWCTYKALTN